MNWGGLWKYCPIQPDMDEIRTVCYCCTSHMQYSNTHIEHEHSLATVRPPNKLITGHRLVPVRVQMFPRHGSKIKPVELVTVASHCFQSIQPNISCRVPCNKQYMYKIIWKAVLALSYNSLHLRLTTDCLMNTSFYSPSNSKTDPQSNIQNSYLWPEQQKSNPNKTVVTQSPEVSFVHVQSNHYSCNKICLVIQKTQHPLQPHHNSINKTPSPSVANTTNHHRVFCEMCLRITMFHMLCFNVVFY